jgi:hypothetical protein
MLFCRFTDVGISLFPAFADFTNHWFSLPNIIILPGLIDIDCPLTPTLSRAGERGQLYK